MALRIIRGFNLIADDTASTHLSIEEMRLPTFEEKSADFTPGGSTQEIDVGLGVTNKLVCPFKLMGDNPAIHSFYGMPPGVRVPFTGRKLVIDELEDDGREIEVTVDMLGRIMKTEPEAMKGGEKSGYDHEISSIIYYREVHDKVVLREFNFKMGGWTIRNGVAVNEGRRRILGFGG